jgi:hypothetical protein
VAAVFHYLYERLLHQPGNQVQDLLPSNAQSGAEPAWTLHW